MAIKLGEGFEITGYDPIDFRLVLTKEQMSKIVGDEDSGSNPDDFAMPEVYFALCIDDGLLYKFDYEADIDPETGKFRKMELGGSTPTAESGPITDRPNPEDGKPGDKWYDPETGKTYIIVKDSEGNQSWVEVTPTAGEMMYDATNDVVMYFDGTEWKPIGGGVEHVSTLPVSADEGEIIFDESTGQYKVYEDGVWLTLAKTWEGTEAEYTTLGGDTWSTNHPDVIMFVK